MKKAPLIVLGSVAVIATVIIVAPVLVKSEAQKQLQAWQAQINNHPELLLEWTQTQDGWFSSQYAARLQVDVAQLDPELAGLFENGVFSIPFQSQLHYGPLFITDGFGLGLLKLNAFIEGNDFSKDIHWDQNRAFYELALTQGLTGKLSFQDTLTPFDVLNDATDEHLTFSGYQGQGHYAPGQLDYQGHFAKAELFSDANVAISNYRVQFDTQASLEQLLSGEFVEYNLLMSLGAMELERLLSLQNLSLTTESNLAQDRAHGNVSIRMGLDNLNVQDLPSMEQVALDLSVNNISTEFTRRYNDFVMSTMWQQNQPEFEGQMLQFWQQNLALAIAGNPEFNVDRFKATVDGGQVSFVAHSKLLTDGQTIEPQQLLAAPDRYLLPLIKADAHLELDQAVVSTLAEQYIAMQLQPRLQQGLMSQAQYDRMVEQSREQILAQIELMGFITKKGDRYESSFDFSQGRATLNGVVMDF